MPEEHSGELVAALRGYYSDLESAARAAGRLPPERNLLGRIWTLKYDIYSPRLRRFLEVDERQHFSAPRLDRIRRSRDSGVEANYPPFFWDHQAARLSERPPHDYTPPYRDEQRAYLDLARELVPPHYDFKPTLRIDQWSVSFYSRNPKSFVEVLLGQE
jgi:hypothetical protein